MKKTRREAIDPRVPRASKLLVPTFNALVALGGSGTNDEILKQIIEDLRISDDIANILHHGSTRKTELQYQEEWARTKLKQAGVITNPQTSVWAISSEYIDRKEITIEDIKNKQNAALDSDSSTEEQESLVTRYYDESEIKEHLSIILSNINPYGFEKLSQRILRECGFNQVEVTRKSGDGGIDGLGTVKFGILSFNVAFQCKRYKSQVGAPEIRDFRGSLTTDIEKGLFITTGTYSKAAIVEASLTGKQKIELIDGEELIDLIISHGIGVSTHKAYCVDELFFQNLG